MLYEGGVTEGTEEVETEDVFDMGGSLQPILIKGCKEQSIVFSKMKGEYRNV